jgi:serine/threonine-protein kinase
MGQNGTGPLYQAYDEHLKTDVVLREIQVKLNKVTTPARMEAIRSAFVREAEILSRIDHGSFIRVSDHFSDIDRHYLVMEVVDGEYLGESLAQKRGPFPVSEVAEWAGQILDGLNYLHAHAPPLVHGDVKPGNIKLASNGAVKLLALGIARDPEKGSSITEQAFDAASLNYLPLEQIWGNLDLASQKVIAGSYDEASGELLTQPPDARSDIFALGATLYHLLTGRRPVDALERSIDILEGKPDPLPTPTKLEANVPPEISYVVMKAMEIRREKRFESALMMRQVLKTAAVRAKEREAQEAKKQPVIAAPEIRLPEPKEIKTAAPAAIQTEAENEIDPQRQLELFKARLQEAENKRLLAEERAANAERRLHEQEISISKAPEEASLLEIPEVSNSANVLKTMEPDLANVLEMPDRRPLKKPVRKAAASVAPADDFEFSFGAQSRSSHWKLLAAAAVLLIVGGGSFAIWTFMSSGAARPAQSIPTPVMSLNAPVTSEPTSGQAVENTPQPAAETASQTSSETGAAPETVNSSASTAPANTTISNNMGGKTKAPTQIAKQVPAAPAKTPAKQKKALTVDDLINDN